MPRPEKTSSRGRFLAVWAAAGLLELPVVSALFGGASAPVPALVLLHFAASGVMFFAPPKGPGWFSPLRRWAEPLALWTLVFPGVGWVFALVLMFAHDPREKRKDFFRAEELDEEGKPFSAGFRLSEEGVQKRLLDAVDVMPAADILLGPDPTLKRGAIETLAKIKTPEAIGWLLKARTDRDPEVRFHATASLTTLKRDFDARIRVAEREVFEHPGEAHRQVLLHRVTYECAVSGLVDPDRRTELLDRCAARLKGLAERGDSALELLFRIEREILPDRALKTLDRLEERMPTRKAAWLKERASLLFRLGRYDEVRDLMIRLKDAGSGGLSKTKTPEESEWQSAALWWGHES